MKNKSKQSPYLLSVVFHTILLALVILIGAVESDEPVKYIEVGFGSGFGTGTSGGGGGGEMIEENKPEEKTPEVKEENEPIKNIEEKIIDKNAKKEISNINKLITKKENKDTVKGFGGKGDGGFGPGGPGTGGFGGFGFDWGGRGTRKILHWEKPEFPPEVSKSIDIKIRFIILPDGSVVSAIPLIKADTRLEDASINSIKSWRFEPLKTQQLQYEQVVVITIPFRIQ